MSIQKELQKLHFSPKLTQAHNRELQSPEVQSAIPDRFKGYHVFSKRPEHTEQSHAPACGHNCNAITGASGSKDRSKEVASVVRV